MRRTFVSRPLLESVDLATISKMADSEETNPARRYDWRLKKAILEAAEKLIVPNSSGKC